jgi:hypothetical protein
MPCPVVEPIPKFVEAMLNEVFRCAKVEPRIDYKTSAGIQFHLCGIARLRQLLIKGSER